MHLVASLSEGVERRCLGCIRTSPGDADASTPVRFGALAASNGTLLGRRAELAAVDAALEELERRRGAVLAFSGEGGIGKTRLLDELAARAGAAGALVLTGRASELERELPFGVWEDALAEHAEFLGVDRLERLVGDQLPELAAVLPAVGRVPAGPAGRALPHAPRGTGAARGARADPAGRARARRPALGRRRLAGARRRTCCGGRRAGASRSRWRSGPRRSGRCWPPRWPPPSATARVIEHPLGALSFADARDAARRRASPAPCAARSTRPAAATRSSCSSSRASTRRAAASPPEPGGAGVPRAVARALEQEIAALSEAGRALAQGAAVAGDPVDLDLAVGRRRPARGGDARRAGRAARGRAAGRHRRRRAATASGTRSCATRSTTRPPTAGGSPRTPARRPRWPTRGGSLAARAHHLERCARPGDDEALEVLIEAGRHAAARAPATAADRFGAALRLLPETPETMPRAARAARRARAGAGGDRAGSRPRWSRSTTGWRWSVRSSRPCARGWSRAARCARTCSAATPPPTRGCSARAGRAGRGLVGGRRPRGRARRRRAVRQRLRRRASRGRARARATASDARRAAAFAAVAVALECFGALGLGRDRRRAGAARGRRRAARRARRRRARAAAWTPPTTSGSPSSSASTTTTRSATSAAASAVSRASGQGQFVIPMTIGLAHALEVRGRLAEAAEAADAAVEGARLWGNRQMLCFALTADAWVSALRGELGRARVRRRRGDGAARRARRERALARDPRARRRRAARGRRARGLPGRDERGRRAGVRGRRTRPPRLAVRDPRPRRAGAGPPGRGRRLGRARRGRRRRPRPPLRRGLRALRPRAARPRRRGDGPAAGTRHRRACARRELADSVGAVIQAGAGADARRAGRRRRVGLPLLERAESDLGSCGAVRLRDEAARELRRRGVKTGARRRRSTGRTGSPASPAASARSPTWSRSAAPTRRSRPSCSSRRRRSRAT